MESLVILGVGYVGCFGSRLDGSGNRWFEELITIEGIFCMHEILGKAESCLKTGKLLFVRIDLLRNSGLTLFKAVSLLCHTWPLSHW